jgi:urease accessory protein
MTRRMALLLGLMITLAPAARAHVESGGAGSLISGLLHPVTGLDHVVAMVAVGLWGAVLAAPAIWLLPVAFPMVMAFGGLIGLLGLPLPGVEVGIAISGMVLGLLVALERRVPLAVALALVGVFALFHGYAHGRELPDGANTLLFSLAFVAATGLLHLVGILLGELRRWPVGRRLVQLVGAAITISGVWFLLQI